MSKISDLLQEVGKDVLNEESLEQIETVFNEAVEKKAEKTPKKYKGFSKLPEAVQRKINKKLAKKV